MIRFRFYSIRVLISSACAMVLSACAFGNGSGLQGGEPFQRRPGQGLYQQPQNLRPQPMQRIPVNDLCQSQMYRGLVGRHEGSVYFSALPGLKRVVKPAETEVARSDFLPDMDILPPNVLIRDYLPGQSIYASSIQTIYGGALDGPEVPERLLIELDDDGYITRVGCG